jgi:hypothetical protein
LIKNTHSSCAEGGGGSRRKAPSDQQPRVFCPLSPYPWGLSLVSWGSCMSHTPASSTGGSVPLLSEPSVRPGPSLSLSIQENDRMIVPFRSVAAHSRIYRSVDFWRGTRTELAEHAGCGTEHICACLISWSRRAWPMSLVVASQSQAPLIQLCCLIHFLH